MRYFSFLSFLLAFSFTALLQAKKSSWSWPPKEKPASVDLSKFSLDSDLEVTLWAKSPMLYNPTNMAIDPQGRIWIAECKLSGETGYPQGSGRQNRSID